MSTEQHTVGQPGESTPHAGASEKRIQANRRNAQRSTGPKTAEGKARSAQNAVKHGVFMSSITPILNGPFAEEPEHLGQAVHEVIGALAPRDPLELTVATRLAGQFLALDRLEKWGAASIEAISDADKPLMPAFPTITLEIYRAGSLSGLFQYLAGQAEVDDFDIERLAHALRDECPKPGIKIPGLWDAESTPQSEAEWVVAIDTIVHHFWKDRKEAASWILPISHDATWKAGHVDVVKKARVANQILNGPLELETRYAARIGREIERLSRLYSELQQRPDEALRKNEPNGEDGHIEE